MDKITRLENNCNRHFGRPDWKKIFSNVREFVEASAYGIPMGENGQSATSTSNNNDNGNKTGKARPKSSGRPRVGCFFCGPAVLSKQLYKFCVNESKVGRPLFTYHKENF